jgi:hypothetical protein
MAAGTILILEMGQLEATVFPLARVLQQQEQSWILSPSSLVVRLFTLQYLAELKLLLQESSQREQA